MSTSVRFVGADLTVRPPEEKLAVLVILAFSCALDPLVLMLLLYAVARRQVDTNYASLFFINVALGVLGTIVAVFTYPFEYTVQLGIVGGGFLLLTTLIITKACCLNIPRSFVVSSLFLSYRGFFVYAFISVLALFGYTVDFSVIELEGLNSSDAPQVIQWLFDHGLWFKRA